jgi:hypothetical protein
MEISGLEHGDVYFVFSFINIENFIGLLKKTALQKI